MSKVPQAAKESAKEFVLAGCGESGMVRDGISYRERDCRYVWCRDLGKE